MQIYIENLGAFSKRIFVINFMANGDKSMSDNAVKAERFHNIDLLKTIAIFFVVFYHGLIIKQNFLLEPSFETYFNFFVISILSTGVPLFFFCNGFLLFNKPLDLKKHIFKTIHLVIVTTIWALLTIAIMMFTDGVRFTPLEFFKAFLDMRQNMIGYLWFMGALVCIHILFPVLKGAFDSSKASIFYMAVIAYIIPLGIMCIERVCSAIVHDAAGVYFKMFNPFSGLLAYSFMYFCLGGLACFYQDEIKQKIEEKHLNVKLIAFGAIIAACACLAVYGVLKSKKMNAVWDMVFASYDSIFTLVNVLAIYLLSMNYRPKEGSAAASAVCFIGANTLGIYLIHEIFLHILTKRLSEIAWCTNIIVNAVYCAAVICVCLAITWLIKKIPLVKHIL